MAKEYVAFYSHGVSVNELKTIEVSSRDVSLAGLIPDGAIYYRFFTSIDGVERLNYSPRYFIADAEYTAGEFKLKYPQLCNNDEFENAARIIKATTTGGFYPLTSDDLVMSA